MSVKKAVKAEAANAAPASKHPVQHKIKNGELKER